MKLRVAVIYGGRSGEHEISVRSARAIMDAMDPAKYERIKKIALLENEFTIEGGELTPTLKVKRRVIDEKYRDVIEKLYAES